MLRRLIGKRWPEKISNNELYKQTESIEWSIEIKKRRLNWYGHLLRLPDDTPAKQALYESDRKVKRPRGKPKITWTNMIKKDLQSQKLQDINEKAQDRDAWRVIVGRAMSNDEVRM